MEMQMEFIRKLPIPAEVKKQFPLDDHLKTIKERNDQEIIDILTGKSNKLLLIIGPCSADNEDAVLEYMHRLRKVADLVKDKIFIVPRVYTNKPRTIGKGYKGMLHQPDPEKPEDMLSGLLAIRHMHTRVIRETGFTCAEEMLYPENHRYLSDLLSYVAVGARSVENQEHRLVAGGIGIPAGMKNPTGGDLSVMMNSIIAAQSPSTFIYRGWEVKSPGNPYAHAILRGYVDKFGNSHPNYHYEDLKIVYNLYQKLGLQNPAAIVDCNHNNSGKKYQEQIRIAKDIMHSRHQSRRIRSLVKGLMIESYLVDGCQKIDEGIYGKSITDPCLGWEKTEKLIFDLANQID
ncbi:3-deoxy-7-phosphoheptulonate synthase [Eggerthia catenaformis OT 569 = DSM 20559]|uniref:Phospho-2-dehydro-3-deoxyheptonate aldolase n=1 Tax=Eggerthia catenaformis OT 569 = DSM 20559 TaxID=999415 RepID=M2PMP2_9FIRM|nr:3-deoxy-7-phosphoheptulonate synthase [Eggerthia catenaformis]EMD16834.1 3-deoxy-7-phosphoheptulonate synthase [Eggerthia catenaformis OT 569 = DSM 20559]OUC51628.1 3-deoxy-7-phosphoheptulonate synthase [Eggerthia catenaformis]